MQLPFGGTSRLPLQEAVWVSSYRCPSHSGLELVGGEVKAGWQAYHHDPKKRGLYWPYGPHDTPSQPISFLKRLSSTTTLGMLSESLKTTSIKADIGSLSCPSHCNYQFYRGGWIKKIRSSGLGGISSPIRCWSKGFHPQTSRWRTWVNV